MELIGQGSKEEQDKAWEEIVQEASEAAGFSQYGEKVEQYKNLLRLLANLLFVRAALTKLFFVVDDGLIEELESLGYHINTTDKVTYEETVLGCLRKSINLHNKISSARAKLIVEETAGAASGEVVFEEVIVSLSASLGYQLSSGILLCEYNAYLKYLTKKQQHGRNK